MMKKGVFPVTLYFEYILHITLLICSHETSLLLTKIPCIFIIFFVGSPRKHVAVIFLVICISTRNVVMYRKLSLSTLSYVPFPGVFTFNLLSLYSVKEMFGNAIAYFNTIKRTFLLASCSLGIAASFCGLLENKFDTEIVVPFIAPTSFNGLIKSPFLYSPFSPMKDELLVFVVIDKSLMHDIEKSASPRNPNVFTFVISLYVSIFEVECLLQTSSISGLLIPSPSSVISMSERPPFLKIIEICEAPESSEFSSNSLTMLYGP